VSYDAADNSAKCYSLAVHELRLQGLRDGKFKPNDTAEELVASGKALDFRHIGPHTIFHGDCADVLPSLGVVDAMITDPPFEQECHAAVRRTAASIKTKTAVQLNFAPMSQDLRAFIPAWASENCTGWLIAFCQVEAVSAWRDAMEAAGLKYKRGMAWIKPDSSPQFNGQMPAQGFECMASAWCGTGHSRWNGGGRRGVFTALTNQPDRQGEHQTEKPIPLMRELVSLFSDDGATVLDPFAGSGTTGIACQRLGRRFIGVELDPNWFNLACRRLEATMAQPDLFIPTAPAPKQEALL